MPISWAGPPRALTWGEEELSEVCSGTLIEEKEDGREDEEDKDEGGGDSLGGSDALLVMGVESIKERTCSIIALLLA